MPTYRYQCAKCGEQFELWQSIHDDSLERHPGCGGRVTKVMSPAGIVLKGPGFYRTDNRAASKRGSKDKEPAKDGASGNGSGSDSKESNGSTSADSKGSQSDSAKGSKSDDSKGSKDKTSKSGSSST
jgi:putative FmdB family regulatory protein